MHYQRVNYVMCVDDDACNVIQESARYTVQFIEACAVKLILTKDCFDCNRFHFSSFAINSNELYWMREWSSVLHGACARAHSMLAARWRCPYNSCAKWAHIKSMQHPFHAMFYSPLNLLYHLNLALSLCRVHSIYHHKWYGNGIEP